MNNTKSNYCFIQWVYEFSGETIVCEAQKVLMYSPLSDRKRSIMGVLTVTTFKLSFASAMESDLSNCYQQNILLGMNDICLSSIDFIYQINDRSKKKLMPGQNVSGKIKDILIVCKVSLNKKRFFKIKLYEYFFQEYEIC